MSMIEALVFDWGGVLQRTASHAARHALDRELGLTIGAVEAAVFESEVWHLASIGQCSAARAWASIGYQLGLAPNQIETFIRRFFAEDRIDQQLVQLISHLRRSGIKVGLLSNAPPGYGPLDVAASRWGQEGLFEIQIFSYQVGALKPDPRTFDAILDALGVAAQQTLFIDDAAVNIAGARQLDIQAHLYVATPSLLATLRSYHLPMP